MIQRIQSVFLFFAAISTTLLFLFPIAWFYGSNNTIEFFIYHVRDHIPDSLPLVETTFLLPLILLTIIIMAVATITLLMYKNLRKQFKLVRIGLFLTLVQIAALFFFYVDHISRKVDAEANYEIGIFLPIITLLFFFLALRGIQKDIKLIRSTDRLR